MRVLVFREMPDMFFIDCIGCNIEITDIVHFAATAMSVQNCLLQYCYVIVIYIMIIILGAFKIEDQAN